MPVGDFFLKTFDHWMKELDDFTTLGADQMVVVLPSILSFIISFSIRKNIFTDQPAFDQKIHCAVDRGNSNFIVQLLHTLIQTLDPDVTLGLQKDL